MIKPPIRDLPLPRVRPTGVVTSTSTLPQRPRQSKPFHSYITLDILVHVLNRSIFHPFIAWLIPLCFRAVETPYSAPRLQYSIGWAVFITVWAILGVINRRVAYGRPRFVDWEDEVVVVTGGSSGLGRLIAEVYGMRGVAVAVLDVERPKDEMQGVEFYQCDVGNRTQVEEVAARIRNDLGVPTVLINNAGIATPGSILGSNTEDVERNLRVNLLSHYHTLQTFLPGMLAEERGTIVTVSSVLGHLGCANLSAYASTKAALIALHSSLRAELTHSTDPAAQEIRTILVTPGQIATPMFSSVQTPSKFLAPVVEPTDVVKEIVRLVDEGESGVVSFPFYSRWIQWLNVLPMGMQRVVRSLSGVDRAMGIGMTDAKIEASA